MSIKDKPLAHDERRAVRLDSLTPGQRVKTPDWPEANIRGLFATLLSVGPGRCTVAVESRAGARDDGADVLMPEDVTLDCVKRTRKTSFTSRAPWGASTMVIPLTEEDEIDERLAKP